MIFPRLPVRIGCTLVCAVAGIVLTGCKDRTASSSTSAPAPAVITPSPAAGAWTLAALPQTWTFSGFKEDEDLSGIAAWDERHCLVCTDEKHDIQPGIMDRTAGTVTAGAGFPLLANAKKKDETDTEGVVAVREHGCYYVTGSHGVAKKSGELQPSRLHVFRVPVNAASGEPEPGGVQVGSLQPWIAKDPVLAASVGKSLRTDGFNIEGLAWKDGKLWFGVRAPNIGSDAFVIEVDAKSLFTGAPQASLHRLAVGAGLGIREIAALRDGFLVLTGESNSDVGPDKEFRLYHWKPGRVPEFIGVLPSPPARAEGLMVLAEQEKSADVLVVFDSAPGGGPRAYRITRN